ncbi:type 1 glutamine amidotransferase domain-containing protein [Gluconacetobacter takamatsuzukensis]|uniref:Type 1 glutamine amidotransferase n=1 Tax=Gluconacetobacter takamatsuzukensis TaxID=1286190 RepID=A0A7W4PRI9_9PROT|nr:type 1 glutamine amidotransferase domain-containing protein [Gluconacetobacter takamatsuzukensis]MBB2205524.1 type 1 glutamine amidotransferase [Gluconacetobacter takamatsuzukensis]
MAELSGRTIAILATDGVEEVELVKPGEALREAGAFTVLVSPGRAEIQAMQADVHPARTYPVERPVMDARAEAFDGLVLPGGTTNPDQLRIDPASVAFVRHFVEAGKPIAAICHGAWTLIEAGGVAGHRMTSWPSLRTDLTNAGAHWVDEEVVTDGPLVTSRRPDDLPAFCTAIVHLFANAPTVPPPSSP